MKDEINADSNEGFMSRWSKRKSNLKHDQGNEKNLKGETELQESNVNEQKTVIKEEVDESQYSDLNDQELLEKFKLPDPEKIKKEKGLDLFFKDGVPDRLRQIALRRVWKLNPIIRFADAEINDYHEDFTDAATVIEGMQTAYQVGKGYLSEILKDEDKNSLDNEGDKKELENKELNSKAKKKATKALKPKSKKEKLKDKTTNAENSESKDNAIKIKNLEIQNKEAKLIDENVFVNTTVEEKPTPKMMVFKPRS
ncbi:DUF3306 domain-containing protein [Alphaproteobacteria bacterium]|nr:DUF3306 domain-containing protein [Alphaproteobacteria bacterium]